MPAEPHGGSFDLAVLESRPGFLCLEIVGEHASDFDNEGGGHRWQRIPPTEKRGRVQTSTVTVAVLQLADENAQLNPSEVEFTTTKGDGPGGQHRNKRESAVIAHHLPTGLKVRIESDRSQHRNKATAHSVLSAKLSALATTSAATEANKNRRAQVGSGERGDKIRTYRQQDNQVKDHRTGKSWQLHRWMNGEW